MKERTAAAYSWVAVSAASAAARAVALATATSPGVAASSTASCASMDSRSAASSSTLARAMDCNRSAIAGCRVGGLDPNGDAEVRCHGACTPLPAVALRLRRVANKRQPAGPVVVVVLTLNCCRKALHGAGSALEHAGNSEPRAVGLVCLPVAPNLAFGPLVDRPAEVVDLTVGRADCPIVAGKVDPAGVADEGGCGHCSPGDGRVIESEIGGHGVCRSLRGDGSLPGDRSHLDTILALAQGNVNDGLVG